MDPLRLLRDAFAKNQIQNVSIDADSIVFPKECFNNNNDDGGVVVPRETSLTRFTSRVKNQKLKLDQIVFFVQKCALTNESLVTDQKEYGKYVKSAITAKIERVPRPDFKDLWEYASGKTAFSERVDLTSDVGAIVPIVGVDGETLTTTTLTTTTSKRTDVDESNEARLAAGREKEEEDEDAIKVVPYATRNASLKRKKDFTLALEKVDPSLVFRSSVNGSTHNRQGGGLRESEKPKELVEAEKIVERGQRRNRYQEKVEEQTFWKERVGSDFNDLFGGDFGDGAGGGFDPNASFLAQPAKKQRTAAEEAAFLASEREEKLREERLAQRQQKQQQQKQSKSTMRGTLGASSSSLAKKQQQKPIKRHGTPLILVPAGLNAKVVLNMFNAKNFLEKEKFEPWQDIQKEAVKNKTKKPTHLSLLRTYKRDQPVKYEITDQVPKISEDWKRVVAVFVHGAKWQFKDWPKHIFPGAATGDLVETFAKVRGFYAKFEQDQTPDVVKTWNVKLLTFRRNQRHGDKAVCSEFWDELDRALALKRSHLLY
jgi:parafibromin